MADWQRAGPPVQARACGEHACLGGKASGHLQVSPSYIVWTLATIAAVAGIVGARLLFSSGGLTFFGGRILATATVGLHPTEALLIAVVLLTVGVAGLFWFTRRRA